jgi:hypothetical protein
MRITQNYIKEYQSNLGESEGGAISNIQIRSGQKNNLFPDIAGTFEENIGRVLHRKIFRTNEHPTQVWKNVVTWIESQPVGALISIGFGLDREDDNDPGQGGMHPLKSDSTIIAVSSDHHDIRRVVIVGEDSSGERIVEKLDLHGKKEIESIFIFSRIYAVYVHEANPKGYISISRGCDGEYIGSISCGQTIIFVWYEHNMRNGDMNSKKTGMKHGDICPGENFALWYRLEWPSYSKRVNNNSIKIKSESEVEH